MVPLFTASTVVWLKAPLQGYAFRVLIVLLLRLLWPPVDGSNFPRDLYKPTHGARREGKGRGMGECYSVTVREEETTVSTALLAIYWRTAVQVYPGLYMSG